MISTIRPYMLTLLFLAAGFGLKAQAPQGSLSGQVTDAGGPVAYATVTLLKAGDSSLVKGAITDEKGRYRFSPVAAGVYLVSASLIGKSRPYSLPVELAAGVSRNIPDLVLQDNAHRLKGVAIKASKPFIEHQVDKTVVNVENSVTSVGQTALEVLQKAPGVMVDNNGNISLNGKGGVTVMIDDKPTYLSAEQISEMLKSMSASELSKIEIITNPSAKYDAAGTAGILNLVLKKNRQEGMNGSATAGYSVAVHSRYDEGLVLNYKKGKVNLFGNMNASQGAWSNRLIISRKFYADQAKRPSSHMEQTSIRRSANGYESFKAGMDYTPDERNSLGFIVYGQFSDRSGHNYGPIGFYDANMRLDSTVRPAGLQDQGWHSISVNGNYRLRIDTGGQELRANIDYSVFVNYSHPAYSTEYFDGAGMPLHVPQYRRGSLPSQIDIRSAKLDYTLPLRHKGKMEAGWKSSLVSSDNNVWYEGRTGGDWETDLGATNHFIYRENINAAYINFSKTWGKDWTLQLGLRGEQTISKANQLTIDSVVKRNYVQLFPSAFVKKGLNKDQTLTASYSRRIERPNYQSLNPFRYYIDDYTYGQGNPFLRPEFTNIFEIAHDYKGMFHTTLSYSHTRDVMTEIIIQNDSTHTAYQTRENLNTQDNAGLSISASLNLTPWWSAQHFVNVYYARYRGVLDGVPLDKGLLAWTANTTNTFILPWDMKAELSGYYQSKRVYGALVADPQYSVSAGLQKSLLNKRATLKVNVNDLFNTQQFRGKLKYNNVDMVIRNRWESRSIGVSLTYTFGNRNMKTEQHKRSGIEDEQSRVGQGN